MSETQQEPKQEETPKEVEKPKEEPQPTPSTATPTTPTPSTTEPKKEETSTSTTTTNNGEEQNKIDEEAKKEMKAEGTLPQSTPPPTQETEKPKKKKGKKKHVHKKKQHHIEPTTTTTPTPTEKKEETEQKPKEEEEKEQKPKKEKESEKKKEEQKEKAKSEADDEEEDEEKSPNGVSPAPKSPGDDLERSVQRFMKGLKSDFGAKRALNAFHGLCEDESTGKTLLTMESVVGSDELLKQLLHMTEVYLETPEALRCLAFLTRNESFASKYLKLNGLKLLLIAMLDKDTALGIDGRPHLENTEAITEYGCRILSNISFSAEAKAELVKSIPIDMILNALRSYQKNVQLQMHATNVLGVLALHSDSARDQMSSQGAVKCVLNAMNEFPAVLRMQEIGSWCLRTLSIGSRTKRQIIEDGGIVALAKAMRTFETTEFLQVQASAALKQLACSDSRYFKFVESGAIESIINAMHSFSTSESVQQRCTGFLSIILENKKAREDVLKFNNVLTELVSSLKIHMANHSVVESVLVCLNYLAQQDPASVVKAFGDAQAIEEVIGNVNKTHPHTNRISSASKALTSTLQASGACTIL